MVFCHNSRKVTKTPDDGILFSNKKKYQSMKIRKTITKWEKKPTVHVKIVQF